MHARMRRLMKAALVNALHEPAVPHARQQLQHAPSGVISVPCRPCISFMAPLWTARPSSLACHLHAGTQLLEVERRDRQPWHRKGGSCVKAASCTGAISRRMPDKAFRFDPATVSECCRHCTGERWLSRLQLLRCMNAL